jgi:error-prone DNA polymerase
MTGYAELQVTSNYSFLRGASHIEELFAQAAVLDLPALGITDRNSLAGIVRAHQRAGETNVRLVVGCRLVLNDGSSVLVYPTDRTAYARLCRLLTLGKRRAGKGACELAWEDLAECAKGLLAILIGDDWCADDGTTCLRSAREATNRGESSLSPARAAPAFPATASGALHRFRDIFTDSIYLALTPRRQPGGAVRLERLSELARAAGVPTVATGDVLYHVSERRILQDVLTCIREGCTIDAAGFRRERFNDRYLRPPAEMARLLARYPDAVARTLEIVDRCHFSLDELRYQYPNEIIHPGRSAQQALEALTWEGAACIYSGNVPEMVAAQLRHELALIAELDYAPYFLTVHSVVQFARTRGIVCQGRGSAANSAVCFVLGVTAVDPIRSNLLFERFVSTERREPPDIDVDFESERREDVIQWVYDTYGRERAALCATVIRYRARGAVREVGKALGLTEDVTAALAGQIWGWSEEGISEAAAAQLNLKLGDRRLRLTLALARELIGFPRHLSQHPGGFVLTQDRLDELVPIEPAAMEQRQVIEWDKDDIDVLRFMKVDVLGLGMLGCMRRAFDLLEDHRGLQISMQSIPQEDHSTYEMICHADTLGTFQIESRAQMSMLPRLKPRTFYDLVIQVAIVRPGPIQGDMVHPYLRRREGKEPVDYPTPELREVLENTLGIPLFQEQAMRVAIVCAGFTPSEADRLRRAMATFRAAGQVSAFHDKLVAGMVTRGYTRDFAEQTFSQIEGFGSYGFPESHAASFAMIAYASAWMKCHHPDVFCTALLNAQPMGFYAPAQIVRDARTHGVEVRPVCVNASRWDCTLEPAAGRFLAVRLGLRMVKGLSNKHAAAIIGAREERGYESIAEMWQRAGVPVAALERIADADGFHAIGLHRRQAVWTIRGLGETGLPLLDAALISKEPAVALPGMTQGGEVVEDYRSLGLTLRRHPVAFLRAELTPKGIVTCAGLSDVRDGANATAAGVVLVRQRPGSASGVIFITIEDETGHANLIVWPSLFEKQRSVVMSASMLACHGKVQKEGEVIHLVADRLTDLSDLLASVAQRDDALPIARGRGDQVTRTGGPDQREQITVRTRDFR